MVGYGAANGGGGAAAAGWTRQSMQALLLPCQFVAVSTSMRRDVSGWKPDGLGHVEQYWYRRWYCRWECCRTPAH
jgi:hypothetical protein